MIDCFVLNLDCCTDRWSQIQNDFAGIPVSLKRVSAVDVRLEPEWLEPEFCRANDFRRAMNRKPTYGEIGCYASHLKAMRQFLGTDAEFAVIAEDDVRPKPKLAEILDELTEYSTVWDLVRLARCRTKGFVPFRNLTDDFQLGTNISGFAFAAAYLLNRHAAESLLRHLTPMKLPFDLALYAGWEDVREMSLLPGGFEMNEQSVVSSIGTERTGASFLSPFWWTGLWFKIRSRRRRYSLQKRRILDLNPNFAEKTDDRKSFDARPSCSPPVKCLPD